MQNTISDPQWNKKNWIPQLNPWHFLLGLSTCWDKNTLTKRVVFQDSHTIQLDIISKYARKNHVEPTNKAQARNRGSRLVLLGGWTILSTADDAKYHFRPPMKQKMNDQSLAATQESNKIRTSFTAAGSFRLLSRHCNSNKVCRRMKQDRFVPNGNSETCGMQKNDHCIHSPAFTIKICMSKKIMHKQKYFEITQIPNHIKKTLRKQSKT